MIIFFLFFYYKKYKWEKHVVCQACKIYIYISRKLLVRNTLSSVFDSCSTYWASHKRCYFTPEDQPLQFLIFNPVCNFSGPTLSWFQVLSKAVHIPSGQNITFLSLWTRNICCGHTSKAAKQGTRYFFKGIATSLFPAGGVIWNVYSNRRFS